METNNAPKPVIYQLLPRLFTNYNPAPVPDGTLEQNGSGKLNQISATVLRHIRELGATHVWYTGVLEHAHTPDYTRYGIPRHNPHIIKGKAGSPYAITDYYDIDPDLSVSVPDRLAEFDRLVARTHRAGLRVIIDFVPNHVAREYHSDAAPADVQDLGRGDNRETFFSPSNNFYYIPRQQFSPMGVDLGHGSDAYVEFPARASGNDCFTAFPGKYDWYDTVKLNYGEAPGYGRHFDPIPSTWLKMRDILCYWARRGVDGFRCDMAHMVPVDFWRWAIPQVKAVSPGVVFIAEIYEVGLYRPYIFDAGFDYLYDKVNLYDSLRAIETAEHSAATLTSCWQTVDGIESHMLNFLENHDEQRFASPQYAGDASRVLPSLVVSTCIGTGPFMLYMGQELGEPGTDAEGYSGRDGRTTIFDYWSIATLRRWLNGGKCDGELTDAERTLRDTYRRVLTLCNSEDAIAHGQFFDLMYVNYDNAAFNPHRHFAFLRKSGEELLLIAVNFGDEAADLCVNIPSHAFDCFGIRPAMLDAVELLGGDAQRCYLSPDQPFATHIDAHGAVIWKMIIDKKSRSDKNRKTKKS